MVHLTPKQRAEIGKLIRSTRRVERQFAETKPHLIDHKRDRDAFQYAHYLNGFEASFNYVRQLPVRRVVDLGAGTTRAINQIAKSSYGVGLEFEAIGGDVAAGH
jgi:hypothetical protein